MTWGRFQPPAGSGIDWSKPFAEFIIGAWLSNGFQGIAAGTSLINGTLRDLSGRGNHSMQPSGIPNTGREIEGWAGNTLATVGTGQAFLIPDRDYFDGDNTWFVAAPICLQNSTHAATLNLIAKYGTATNRSWHLEWQSNENLNFKLLDTSDVSTTLTSSTALNDQGLKWPFVVFGFDSLANLMVLKWVKYNSGVLISNTASYTSVPKSTSQNIQFGAGEPGMRMRGAYIFNRLPPDILILRLAADPYFFIQEPWVAVQAGAEVVGHPATRRTSLVQHRREQRILGVEGVGVI